MVRVEKLKKYFDGVKAVDGISFSVKKGEILGLLGPNGAGKTTTMRVMTGFLRPTSGRVLIGGTDPEIDPITAKKKIGYLPESSPLYPEMNVFEYLSFIAKLRGISGKNIKSSIEEKIKLCGLVPMIYRDIKTLSKGYRQRVGIARVLLGEPDILILDEPSSGLDPNQIVEIRGLIKRIGKKRTIILSTHILSEISASCDNVLILNKGKIVANGPVSDIINDYEGQDIIRVSIRGEKNIINELFGGLDFIKNIDMKSAHDGVFEYRLQVLEGKNAEETIFKEVFSKNMSILELTKESTDLEDSFIKLTKEEKR